MDDCLFLVVLCLMVFIGLNVIEGFVVWLGMGVEE